MERKLIKHFLNLKKNYSVTDYVKAISKKAGRQLKKYEITTRLKAMQREGQIRFSIVNNTIVGFTLPVC